MAGAARDGLLSERSLKMAAYALCGFANFASVGIQIGGISPLAPERRSDLSRLALRAMIGGAFASWMTATIAGMFL
jgi:CNT family concentrative nucleoside transporter